MKYILFCLVLFPIISRACGPSEPVELKTGKNYKIKGAYYQDFFLSGARAEFVEINILKNDKSTVVEKIVNFPVIQKQEIENSFSPAKPIYVFNFKTGSNAFPAGYFIKAILKQNNIITSILLETTWGNKSGCDKPKIEEI